MAIKYYQNSFKYLLRFRQQELGVGRVGGPEGDWGSSEPGGDLAGDLGSRMCGVDGVHGARGVHVLGPLPAVVVAVGVAHHGVDRFGQASRGLEQEICVPSQSFRSANPLVSHPVSELDDAPRQQRRRERHREAVLHVVSGVVVSPRQINLDIN